MKHRSSLGAFRASAAGCLVVGSLAALAIIFGAAATAADYPLK